MSYQVLARKWRPRSFGEIVGQPVAVQALTNALEQNRLHHAYLLTGSRGVGKTTLARILAKCLNCEQGITSTPCNQCSHCEAINQGRFFDLYEIDAASRTKVEDTRDLLQDVQCAPTQGRCKVYLIDEVHMLSNHSFNALLKTLEEPPPHVKFILATTDPQRLPITVLSRCLQFHLKNVSTEQISQHISYILEQEKIHYELPAVQQLAQAAQGSIRDALSLLDQAIAYGNGQVTSVEVKTLLGSSEPELLFALLNALIEKNAQNMMHAITELAAFNTDFATALEELISLLHQIALQQAIPTDNANPSITEMASRLSSEETQLYYQIAITGRRDLPLAPTPRSGFEMTLLRMLAFRPQSASAIPADSVEAMATPQNSTPVATMAAPATEHHDWAHLLSQLNLQGAAYVLASHCVQTLRTDHEIELLLDEAQAALLNPTAAQRIERALQTYLNQALKLRIKIGTSGQGTPVMLDKARQEQQQSRATKAITENQHVQMFIDQFNAQIIPNSIKTRNDADL